MSKIRINELARQLEVKSREVIDKLHELGIAEKVTHSSSIDEDKADQLRRYYSGESHAPLPAATRRNGHGTAAATAAEEQSREEAPPRAEARTADARTGDARVAPAPPAEAAASHVTEPKSEPAQEASPAQVSPQAVAEKSEDDNRPRAIPLRPPVLGRG